jgi:hypothetical protein
VGNEVERVDSIVFLQISDVILSVTSHPFGKPAWVAKLQNEAATPGD